MSDVGVDLAMEITKELRQEAKLTKAKSADDLRQLIVEKKLSINLMKINCHQS